jgi:2-methylisocitrate lyase-like PEP mutase family enzyme
VGLAGIQIEDQDFPKRCGHLPGKELVPARVMAEKIRRASTGRRGR